MAAPRNTKAGAVVGGPKVYSIEDVGRSLFQSDAGVDVLKRYSMSCATIAADQVLRCIIGKLAVVEGGPVLIALGNGHRLRCTVELTT